VDRRRWLAACAGGGTLGWNSGARASDGVTDNEVVFGQSAVLTGPLGVPIQRLLGGVQAALDVVNSSGGVAGRRIRLISLDDQLAPPKAVANYRQLLEVDKVFSLFACVGSGTTAAAATVLHDSDAVSLAGYAVADSARERMGRSGFFIRATTRREAEVLVRQMMTIGFTRIAVAHLDNPGGVEALQLITAALETSQLKPVVAAAIKGDGSNAADAATRLAAANPQSVIMYLGGRAPADLMTGMAAAGSHPSFYGMSIVSGEIAAQVLGEKARGLAIAQLMPFPWFKGSTDLQVYQRLMERSKVDISYYSLEGWLSAQVLVEALRRCGRDLTRARFATTLRGLKTRIGGLDIDFTGGQTAASRFVELVQVRADGTFAR